MASSSSFHSSDSLSSRSLESVSNWDYFNLIIVRPILAVSFVLLFISLGWVLAWKLVLVHVPLVREIFGLRKKPAQPKPPTRRRLSRYYNTRNPTSGRTNISETSAGD